MPNLTQAKAAAELEISPDWLRKLAKRGVITRNADKTYPDPKFREEYEAFKQSSEKKRSSGFGDENYEAARARKTTAQAGLAELELLVRESELISIPERNVIPKPLQKPHPPLWQTVASPSAFEMAGELGVGILCNTLFTPLDAIAELFTHYDRGLEKCRPAGDFVNNQRAVFTFMYCAETRQEAIDSRAAEAALWFMNEAPLVFRASRSQWLETVRGNISDLPFQFETEEQPGEAADDPVPVVALMNRQHAGEAIDPVEAYEVLEAIDSVLIGDVDLCQRKIERCAAMGVDRLMCLMQMGPLPHESVLRSLRNAGEGLIPVL